MFLGLAIIVFFFFFPEDRVSLCSPGCPGTHFVDHAGLKLEIRLPLPPEYWD
ncbi:mCG146985 [Mus musculus]|nr:mCG146985 [Mus musculus]